MLRLQYLTRTKELRSTAPLISYGQNNCRVKSRRRGFEVL